MKRIVWSLVAGLILALSLSTSCTPPTPAEQPGEEKVAIDAVPSGVLEAAKKQEPGVEFQWAMKSWQDGVLVYKVQGQSGEGQIHEVDVNSNGEVLAPGGK
jgi:hypothetical protein